jgi:hypothetical protein
MIAQPATRVCGRYETGRSMYHSNGPGCYISRPMYDTHSGVYERCDTARVEVSG